MNCSQIDGVQSSMVHRSQLYDMKILAKKERKVMHPSLFSPLLIYFTHYLIQ